MKKIPFAFVRRSWNSFGMAMLAMVSVMLFGACLNEDPVVGQQEQGLKEYQVVPIAERLMEEDPSLLDNLPERVDTKTCCDDNQTVSPESVVVDYEPTDQDVKDMMVSAFDMSKGISDRACFRTSNTPVKSWYNNQCCFAATCCRWVLTSFFPPRVKADCVPGQVGCIINSNCSRG